MFRKWPQIFSYVACDSKLAPRLEDRLMYSSQQISWLEPASRESLYLSPGNFTTEYIGNDLRKKTPLGVDYDWA